MRIYVRVNNFQNVPSGTFILWVSTAPVGISSKGDLSSSNTKCSRVWNLETKNRANTSIELTLKCHKFLQGDTEVAKLQIPMSWLPSNSVVREWYPFKFSCNDYKKGKQIMAEIEIHSNENNSKPFQAPQANLLVNPAWDRPGKPNQAPPPGPYPGQAPPPGMPYPMPNQMPQMMIDPRTGQPMPMPVPMPYGQPGMQPPMNPYPTPSAGQYQQPPPEYMQPGMPYMQPPMPYANPGMPGVDYPPQPGMMYPSPQAAPPYPPQPVPFQQPMPEQKPGQPHISTEQHSQPGQMPMGYPPQQQGGPMFAPPPQMYGNAQQGTPNLQVIPPNTQDEIQNIPSYPDI